MSLKGKATAVSTPAIKNALTAPLVYFDNVPVYGAGQGSVDVELTSRLLMAETDGSVSTHMVCTGHLRCSPQAAAILIDALQKALKMHEKQAAPSAPLNS